MNEQLAVNYCAGCARYGVVLAATGVPLQQADYADLGLVDRNTFHHVFSGLDDDQRSELEQWVTVGKNPKPDPKIAPEELVSAWDTVRTNFANCAGDNNTGECYKKPTSTKDRTIETGINTLTAAVKTYGEAATQENADVRKAYIKRLKLVVDTYNNAHVKNDMHKLKLNILLRTAKEQINTIDTKFGKNKSGKKEVADLSQTSINFGAFKSEPIPDTK